MMDLILAFLVSLGIAALPTDMCPQAFPRTYSFGDQYFKPYTHSQDSSGNLWVGGQFNSKPVFFKMQFPTYEVTYRKSVTSPEVTNLLAWKSSGIDASCLVMVTYNEPLIMFFDTATNSVSKAIWLKSPNNDQEKYTRGGEY